MNSMEYRIEDKDGQCFFWGRERCDELTTKWEDKIKNENYDLKI